MEWDASGLVAEVLFGERKLLAGAHDIQALRARCGQLDDVTTDPEYFIAANTLKNRRPLAVLIRKQNELRACVFFMEHCKFGIGLGVVRGGDAIGEGLVVGPERNQLRYVHMATRALLRHWRIHSLSLGVLAPWEQCAEILSPDTPYREIAGRDIARKFPLASTYQGTLASLGPRTRRSLAGKRQQLEARSGVVFVPSLTPTQALDAMLSMRTRCFPVRKEGFYQARHRLLCARPEFFCMGLRLPGGTWLSILTGWRLHGITYVDLQLNDVSYKKESISAVMRAFLMEHEIDRRHSLINFIGGCSMLLRRYCRPTEPSAELLLWRPCLRAALTQRLRKVIRQVPEPGKDGAFFHVQPG